jgi:hypothetical protein
MNLPAQQGFMTGGMMLSNSMKSSELPTERCNLKSLQLRNCGHILIKTHPPSLSPQG